MCSGCPVLSAHRKHVVHLCDAGRVEAQRLVERLRFLRGLSHRTTRAVSQWVSWQTGEGRVCCRLQDGYIGVQGRAHIEHLFHGRDA